MTTTTMTTSKYPATRCLEHASQHLERLYAQQTSNPSPELDVEILLAEKERDCAPEKQMEMEHLFRDFDSATTWANHNDPVRNKRGNYLNYCVRYQTNRAGEVENPPVSHLEEEHHYYDEDTSFLQVYDIKVTPSEVLGEKPVLTAYIDFQVDYQLEEECLNPDHERLEWGGHPFQKDAFDYTRFQNPDTLEADLLECAAVGNANEWFFDAHCDIDRFQSVESFHSEEHDLGELEDYTMKYVTELPFNAKYVECYVRRKVRTKHVYDLSCEQLELISTHPLASDLRKKEAREELAERPC